MAVRAPTTHGTPSSRLTMAAWQVMPPPSVTTAAARRSVGSQSGFVIGATSTSPSAQRAAFARCGQHPGHARGDARRGAQPTQQDGSGRGRLRWRRGGEGGDGPRLGRWRGRRRRRSTTRCPWARRSAPPPAGRAAATCRTAAGRRTRRDASSAARSTRRSPCSPATILWLFVPIRSSTICKGALVTAYVSGSTRPPTTTSPWPNAPSITIRPRSPVTGSAVKATPDVGCRDHGLDHDGDRRLGRHPVGGAVDEHPFGEERGPGVHDRRRDSRRSPPRS